MDYKIIVDSCGELTDEMKKSGIYETASLSMQIDGVTIVDDETFRKTCSDELRQAQSVPGHPVPRRRNIWNFMQAVRNGSMW